MISSLNLEMEERFAPSRPYRLGTRRRRAPKRATHQAVGASRPRGARATSLDTEKLLKTTVQDRLEEQTTERDRYFAQEVLRNRLHSTLRKIWHAHKVAGDLTGEAKWEKAWLQVENCQTQYIGYKAECCGERTRPLAVPIGCNHRLCPVCAWHRSQVARVRIKTLFDRLTHPVLITLTIPNQRSIRKHDYTLFRQRVRKFIAQHKAWIKGGVYSLETTYNRSERSWHVHCHILADVATSLPTKENKVRLAGSNVCLFTAIKLRLEFDWMRLWAQGWGKKLRTARARCAKPEMNSTLRHGSRAVVRIACANGAMAATSPFRASAIPSLRRALTGTCRIGASSIFGRFSIATAPRAKC